MKPLIEYIGDHEKRISKLEAQGLLGPATCSASSPKNPHIIVGEGRRCLCGLYNGEPIDCKSILASLDELVKMANINGSGVHLYIVDIRRLDAVIRPLVQDCELMPNDPDSATGRETKNQMTLANQTTTANTRSLNPVCSAAGTTTRLTMASIKAAIASMPSPPKWTNCVAKPEHVARLSLEIPASKQTPLGGIRVWSKPNQVADCWMFSDEKILMRYLNDELTELDLMELVRTGAVQPNAPHEPCGAKNDNRESANQ
jgi:hypothetical protein